METKRGLFCLVANLVTLFAVVGAIVHYTTSPGVRARCAAASVLDRFPATCSWLHDQLRHIFIIYSFMRTIHVVIALYCYHTSRE